MNMAPLFMLKFIPSNLSSSVVVMALAVKSPFESLIHTRFVVKSRCDDFVAIGLEIFKNAKLVVVIFEAVKSPLASLTQILFGVIVGADAAFKVFPSNERLFPAVMVFCF